jgi:excisionase family DNA binding protein
MGEDIEHYIPVKQAAGVIGVSPLYVRLLAGQGLLPAKAIGERSGDWKGTNASRQRAILYLVDPRPESRNWRTYQEAADALGVERSEVRALVRQGELEVIETGDARLKVVRDSSLRQLLDQRQAEGEA